MVRKVIDSLLSRLASVFAATPADREVVDTAGDRPERSPAETGSLQIPCRELAEKYFRIGLSEVEKESFQAAAEAFEAALELDPASHGACHYLGFCHVKLGLYDEAIRLFNKAIEIGPDNPDYYISIGDTYALMGRYEDAVKYFERVLEAKPDDGLTYAKNAHALMELNALDKAWEMVCKSIELNPSAYAEKIWSDINFRQYCASKPREGVDSSIAKYLAEIDSYLREAEVSFGRARACIQNLYKSHPKNESVRAKLALVHWKSGRLDQALAVLNRFISVHTDNLEYRMLRAQILKAQGKWKEAYQECEYVLTADPMNKELYHEFYIIVTALGRDDSLEFDVYNRLIDIFDKALRLEVFADAPYDSNVTNQSFFIGTRQFQRLQHKGIERGIPAIHINGQSRSATTYLQYTLCHGLDIPGCYICAGSHTSRCTMMPTAAKLFALGGTLFVGHWIPTPQILADLMKYKMNKVVVNIRDPRDCMFSEISLYDRLLGESNWLSELQVVSGRLSSAADEGFLRERMKSIMRFHNQVCDGWLRAAQEQQDVRILINRFDDLVADNHAYINRVLDFLEIDRDQFSWDKVLDKKDTPYFYRGKSQVWREHLSDEDREFAWSLITPLVKEYLNLEP